MTKLNNHLVKDRGRLTWRVYVKAKLLIWLDIKNLWLDKAIGPKYVQRVSSIRYRDESFRYDKARYIEIRVVEKAKDPK